jgi:hypothetical protein
MLFEKGLDIVSRLISDEIPGFEGDVMADSTKCWSDTLVSTGDEQLQTRVEARPFCEGVHENPSLCRM